MPVPLPVLETLNVSGIRVKSAVTDSTWFMVTVQVPVPEQPPPDQPAKLDPVAGEAVKVTLVPWSKLAEHVEPQLIPVGLEVTVPLPLPDFDTLKVYVGTGSNVAVTASAWFMVTVHEPLPLQAPDQPAKLEPVPAAAVNVTCVP